MTASVLACILTGIIAFDAGLLLGLWANAPEEPSDRADDFGTVDNHWDAPRPDPVRDLALRMAKEAFLQPEQHVLFMRDAQRVLDGEAALRNGVRS